MTHRLGLAASRILLPLAASLALAAAAGAAPPRIFLTWNAPYGAPGASENLTVACGDTTKVDTLYLCFDPGRDSTTITAVDALLWFRPAPGDTLDRHWWFESHSNPANLRVHYNPDGVIGASRVWSSDGIGGARSHSTPAEAFTRMVYAVRTMDRATIYGGRVYCFTRVLVPRPPRKDICARPICIEWDWAGFAHSKGDKEQCRRGSRFVTWNPGSKDPCAAEREKARVSPWLGPSSPKR